MQPPCSQPWEAVNGTSQASSNSTTHVFWKPDTIATNHLAQNNSLLWERQKWMECKEELNLAAVIFRTVENAETALKSCIEEAIKSKFVSDIFTSDNGFGTRTVQNVIHHFFQMHDNNWGGCGDARPDMVTKSTDGCPAWTTADMQRSPTTTEPPFSTSSTPTWWQKSKWCESSLDSWTQHHPPVHEGAHRTPAPWAPGGGHLHKHNTRKSPSCRVGLDWTKLAVRRESDTVNNDNDNNQHLQNCLSPLFLNASSVLFRIFNINQWASTPKHRSWGQNVLQSLTKWLCNFGCRCNKSFLQTGYLVPHF